MWVRATALSLITVASLGQGAAMSAGAAQAVPTVPGAAAAEVWGPVHRFEASSAGQSMVVDGRGLTTVVWGSQRGWPEPVKAAQRTAAGRWLDPATLGVGYSPVVAADADGNLTAAWMRDRTGVTTGVWAARKPVGKPWTRPVHISTDRPAAGYPSGEGVYGAQHLDIAVQPGGAALVAWQWGSQDRDVAFRIQAAYRPARGGWDAAQRLTPAADATDAHVAVAPKGAFWVAYQRTPAQGPTAIKVRARSAAGTWSPAARVAKGTLGDLGVDRGGDVTVALSRGGRAWAAVRTAGLWQAPVAVTPTDAKVGFGEWSFATNRAGAAVLAYLSTSDRIDVVRRTTQGDWTAPVTLTEPEDPVWMVVASLNRRGDMFAAWGAYGLWGSYRPAGSDWHEVTTIQPDAGVDVLEDVQAAVAPDGDVVLLWEQEARPLRARVMSAD